jgi:hypothetical protein
VLRSAHLEHALTKQLDVAREQARKPYDAPEAAWPPARDPRHCAHERYGGIAVLAAYLVDSTSTVTEYGAKL